TAAEIPTLDRWTIEHGTPGHVLMERAGAGAVRVLRERLRRPRGPVVVVCGRGNNGGDGFVVARHLRRARVPVEVWLAARPEEVRGEAARRLAAVAPGTGLLGSEEVGAHLPPRRRDAHKGDFGHVLVIAGSRGKTGAALLAAQAVARSGAGLTTLAVPATLQAVLEAQVREAMTAALADTGDGAAALADGAAASALLADRGAVVCGPGLGQASATRELIRHVVRQCTAPLVLDADGLNAVAGTSVLRDRPGPTVITPHPGEMARLSGGDTARVQADRLGTARAFARAERVVVVLKGARTVIASPAGPTAICPTGTPAMAGGGA